MATQDVLQRGGREEEFLAQPKLLAGRRGIGRIKDAGQRLGLVAFPQRTDMVAGVEGVEQDRIDRLRGPESQRVDAPGAPADDGGVVGGGDDALLRAPDAAAGAVGGRADGLDGTAEADLIGAFAALELPRIAVGEPRFRKLDLPAVLQLLPEEAVDVADAVAIGGDIDGRERFHEAGGQASEAAIAEGGVRLEGGDHVEIDAERGEGIAHLVHQFQVGDRVAHQATDEELERQVVDPLLALVVGLAGRFHPAVDDAVAQDEDRCRQPVVRLGDLGILADAIGQPLDDLGGQDLGTGDARRRRGQRGFR